MANQYGIQTAEAEKFAHSYVDNPEGQQAKVRRFGNKVKSEYKNGTMGNVI